MDNSKASQDPLAATESRLQEIESRLDKLESGPLSTGETALSSAGVELSRINEAIGKMAEAESQSEILAVYLEEALSLANRGILFLKEDEAYSKWQSIGFDSVQVEPVGTHDQSSPIIRAAADRTVIVRGENLDEAFPWLSGGEPPRMSLCIPLVFKDAVPVVLYLDSPDEIPVDSLELLTHLAVLILKNQYLQQPPTLESTEGEEAAAEAIPSPEPSQSSEKEEEPSGETSEEPAAMIEEAAEATTEEPVLQLAGTGNEEETPSPQGSEDDAQPQGDSLTGEGTEADPEPSLAMPKEVEAQESESPEPSLASPDVPAAEEEESELEPALTLQSDPAPEGAQEDLEQTAVVSSEVSDPEVAQAAAEPSSPQKKEPDPQPEEAPAEPASEPEAAASKPVPELAEFSYRKVPLPGEEASTESEDKE